MEANNALMILSRMDEIQQRLGDLLRATTFKKMPEEVDQLEQDELIIFGLDIILEGIKANKRQLDELETRVDLAEEQVLDLNNEIFEEDEDAEDSEEQSSDT